MIAPPAVASAFASAAADASGTGLSITPATQTAHPFSQLGALGVAQSAVPGTPASAALTAAALNQWLQEPSTPDESPGPLQVRGLFASGGQLHLRFNQALDAARLTGPGAAGEPFTSTHLLVMRDGVALPGSLVFDPDGAGLRFIAEGGGLAAGDYTVLIAARDGGVVNRRGELLDGDFDGRAGGDYRARITLPALPRQVSGSQLSPVVDLAAAAWGSGLGLLNVTARAKGRQRGASEARLPTDFRLVHQAPDWVSRWLAPNARRAVNDWCIRL